MQWECKLNAGPNVFIGVSPIIDYNGGLFDAADTLAEALERWIVREEFREELRKNDTQNSH